MRIRTGVTWKGGEAEIGGKKHYFRSMWERNYARYLEWLKEKGQISDWKYESTTFWFEAIRRGTRCYTPDFEVTEKNGTVVFHEVKGWMDDRSKTKLKRMLKYHPAVKMLVIDGNAYAAIKKQLARAIVGWEGSLPRGR